MSTLETLIGTPLHLLSDSDQSIFIEDLRQYRQTFTETAYETRKSRRKIPKVNIKLEALTDEDFDL